MDLNFEFAQIMSVVVRRWRGRVEAPLAACGLTYARWSVLYWIARNDGGINQRALTEIVGVEPPVLSRHLDVLEAQGLVRRVESPADRRSNLVTLTETAPAVIERIEKVLRRELREALGGVNMLKADTFLDVLHTIHERLAGPVEERPQARARQG